VSATDEHIGPGERADARRNRQLLLDAAASCIAEQGLSVAALDIAERAGVGVATLYRRFTTKEALIEQILLDIFATLDEVGAYALENPDPWSGFADFIETITAMTVQNSGLAEALESVSTPAVATGQRSVRNTIQLLTQRAQQAGVLRTDISWTDIVFLPKSVLASSRCLGLNAGEHSSQRILTVLLDGLRTPTPSPLPGRAPRG
jgi:AcrR family transcriptional regulator